MEVFGGIFLSLLAIVVLAGVGLMTMVAFAAMALLGLITELSFKRVFFLSFGIGLLAPIVLGIAISSAVADGSIERDLRDELGDVIQLPDDMGDGWDEKLSELREISRKVDSGEMTDEEAEQRVEQIFSEFEDLQIGIDVNGDGVVIGEGDSGVPLDVPEAVETGLVGE